MRSESAPKEHGGDAVLRAAAQAAARPEVRYETFADVEGTARGFYELMASGRFLPGEALLAHAARPGAQLSASFVLPVEDSMEGIFNAARDAALVRKAGAGVGFSLSRLRPEGAAVGKSGGVASGPVSFLRVFGVAAGTVRGEAEPGGNVCVLRADHPDILAFLRCRTGGETGFALAVGVTDAFLKAAGEGGEYELTDPHTRAAAGTLRARDVLDEMAAEALRGGLRFVFLDRVNRDNVVPMQGDIEAVDAVTAQPLLPCESCMTGFVNLAAMARDGKVDYALLRETVHEAVHFLDNAVDANRCPLEEISRTARATRKLGLGVMGFAELLDQLGVAYGSDDAVQLAAGLMNFINTEGHAASTALASKRGSFPLFAESIYQHGAPMRNATVTALAPSDEAAARAGCTPGAGPAPGSDATPEQILRVRAAFQTHTDNAVEDALALPAGTGKDEAARLILLAASLGCKSIAIPAAPEAPQPEAAPGEADAPDTPPKAEVPAPEKPVPERPAAAQETAPRAARPSVAHGFTEHVPVGCGELYVTVNSDERGVCEVLLGNTAIGCPGRGEAVSRLIGLALRAGVPPAEICAQLRDIRCPSAARGTDAGRVSCPQAAAAVLERAAGLSK